MPDITRLNGVIKALEQGQTAFVAFTPVDIESAVAMASSKLDGVNGSRPPAMSGLTLQPTKPKSFTQRSSSSAHSFGPTPGDCGNWQTGEILSGKSLATRAIKSLHASVQ